MPRRRPPRRQPSAFDAFFDQIIDAVVERAEDIITPAMEEISGRVAEMVEAQVSGRAPDNGAFHGKPGPRTRSGPRKGVMSCTLCGKPARECRCRPNTPPASPPPSVRRESTLYDDLEVSPKASPETIRAAYLSLSKRYHPDVSPGPLALKKMQDISAAYNIIGDAKKRAQYDRKIGL